jgi:hypothetical protein
MEVHASMVDSESFVAFVALHRADLVRAAERIAVDHAHKILSRRLAVV